MRKAEVQIGNSFRMAVAVPQKDARNHENLRPIGETGVLGSRFRNQKGNSG